MIRSQGLYLRVKYLMAVMGLFSRLQGHHALNHNRTLTNEMIINGTSLKSITSSSVSVTVPEGALIVKPKGGENVKEEVFSEKAKKSKLNGGHSVSNPHPPPGRPMCFRLPTSFRYGHVFFPKVSQVFCRFHEILGLEEAFPSEKLEQELINPVLDGFFLDKSGKEANRSEMNLNDMDCTASKFLSLFDKSRQPSSQLE